MRISAFIVALLLAAPAGAQVENQFDMTDANMAMSAITYGLDNLVPGDQVRWSRGANHGRATIGEYVAGGACRSVKITATSRAGTASDTYTMCQDGDGYWKNRDPNHQPSMEVKIHSIVAQHGACAIYNVMIAYPRTALSAGAVLRNQNICHDQRGFYELR